MAISHKLVWLIWDLRTGGPWFDSQLGQYSFLKLIIIIASELTPVSLLSIALTMVMRETSQMDGKNIVRNTGKKTYKKNAWISALATAI